MVDPYRMFWLGKVLFKIPMEGSHDFWAVHVGGKHKVFACDPAQFFTPDVYTREPIGLAFSVHLNDDGGIDEMYLFKEKQRWIDIERFLGC